MPKVNRRADSPELETILQILQTEDSYRFIDPTNVEHILSVRDADQDAV
jgi:hypothetical protein